MRILLNKFHHYVYCVFPLIASTYNWSCRFESDIQRAILKVCSHPGINTKVRLKKAIKLCKKILEAPQLFDYFVY